MDSTTKPEAVLDDIRVHVKLKISALWAAVMFCYVYGDIFWFYKPGKMQEVLAGQMPPFGQVTQSVLLVTTVSMAIPAVMIFLSVALKARVNRRLNIIMGALYTIFVLATMPGAWSFYLFMGSLDVILTVLIVWYAWHWPKQS